MPTTQSEEPVSHHHVGQSTAWHSSSCLGLVTLQVTDALRYMHQHRIMHRDIKPVRGWVFDAQASTHICTGKRCRHQHGHMHRHMHRRNKERTTPSVCSHCAIVLWQCPAHSHTSCGLVIVSSEHVGRHRGALQGGGTYVDGCVGCIIKEGLGAGPGAPGSGGHASGPRDRGQGTEGRGQGTGGQAAHEPGGPGPGTWNQGPGSCGQGSRARDHRPGTWDL